MKHSNLSGSHVFHSTAFTSPDPGSPNTAVSERLFIQTDLAQPSHYAKTMANDVPDLYYDLDTGYSASPPSAASSSMMPTPLYAWDIPLPAEGSPSMAAAVKSSLRGYSFDQWSLDSYPDPYPSCDSGYSSSQFQYDPPNHEWLDELNWEKQRHAPEFSSSDLYPSEAHTNHYTSAQPSHSQSISTHTASTRHDTQHKQVVSASSLSASSPFSNTVSPSMLMLSKNIPSSSTAGMPTAPDAPLTVVSQPQTPLKLHQPRPSRRIPIISLAELASASEEVLKQKMSKTLPRSPLQALSPLPLDCQGFASGSSRSKPYQTHYPSVPSAPTVGSQSGAFITCSCGCMESYAM